MDLEDGFANQRMCVVPRPAIAEALTAPVTRRLVVTDAGYFPGAQKHRRERTTGIMETIVIVCVNGAGWVEVNGERTRVGPSTAIVLDRGVPHSYGASDDSPWTIWWCHLRGTDIADLVEATEITAARPTIALRSADRVTALLDEIVSSLERDTSPARLLSTAGMAWRLMTQLAADRKLPERGEPIERAMRYLAERVDGTIQVPELAALVGVSASHLSTLFRQATGGGVLAHHTALKMALARRLLDTTTLGIAEVGHEVGYSDQFYFSRQFRRVHGQSPSAYRSQHKG